MIKLLLIKIGFSTSCLTSLRDVSASGTEKSTIACLEWKDKIQEQEGCVQPGITNSCFTCMKLPTESYERQLLLVKNGTIRLVNFRILI